MTISLSLPPTKPNTKPNTHLSLSPAPKQSPLGTLAHLTRTHGSISLWRGVVPTAWREAIYTAGQFPCRES